MKTTTAAKLFFISCRKTKKFNESYKGSARVPNLCTFPSQPTQNKQVHYGGLFYKTLSSRI